MTMTSDVEERSPHSVLPALKHLANGGGAASNGAAANGSASGASSPDGGSDQASPRFLDLLRASLRVEHLRSYY